ncbi:MAG TPA: septal ring lytic transglycosylase RlpA family protein [Baekduia sp.]|uniref:septal ring lytic transglycosylase RlpA family protein n=1 Tax=Baekduia sp. TaxID=2600305 RepID=UPI002C64676A|nr:septal ring lytic transglycosylase RlpA family protein [Baekduia sp.]HMJ36815.1 septal ring lytic transglycosylase RlpA family protein [Baekduia sp.]
MPYTPLVKLGAALGVALALAVPAVASADAAPGGLSYDDPTAPTVFADGSTLAAPLGEIVGTVVQLHGALAGSHPGDPVLVQRLDATAGWVAVATATVGADGSYDAVWRTDHAGRTTVRAVPGGQGATAAASTAAGTEGRAITVYHGAKVTWYGPGFYGKKTACGRKLTRALLGVANKTLPCGTMVELYNDGRTVTVPVVDRGPFRKGTSYDLTAATAKALGVVASTTIGAVRAVTPPA